MRLIYDTNHEPAIGRYKDSFVEDANNGTYYFYDSQGTWFYINVNTVPEEFALALSHKEDAILPGTTSQFWRGDKSWQPFSSLPISTATQAALDNKVTKGSLIFNVMDNGAIGNGIANDSAALTALFSGGHKKIYFPAGTFLLKSYVRVYEYTEVILHKDAVIMIDNLTGETAFANGEVGNTTFSYLYNGPGNIIFRGGTMDCAPMVARSALCEPIAIAHAENVLIDGVTFKNNYQNHFIEFNSTKHGVIRNCRFENTTITSPGSRECINIDYSFNTGFPHFGGYDNTVCEDIIIENNVFLTGDLAAGSHSVPSGTTFHKNIKFVGNYVSGMVSAGVAPQWWLHSRIQNNEFYNCGARGIKGWGINESVISENTIVGQCSTQGITIDDNSGRLASNNIVRNNTIRDITGTGTAIGGGNSNDVINNYYFGIGTIAIDAAADTDRARIVDNIIHGANQGNTSQSAIVIRGTNVQSRRNKVDSDGYAVQYTYAMFINNSATNCSTEGEVLTSGSAGSGSPYRFPDSAVSNPVKVDGTYRVEIADDGVANIPVILVNKQGLAVLMAHSILASASTGLIRYRCNTGELVMELISGPASSTNVTYTTGTLTGTTGTDGWVTISAIDSFIQIENRTGGSKFYRLQIFGQ